MFRRTQTSRPEVFDRENERNSSMSFLRFPDKPNPHSILLVFKQYDYRQGFGETGRGGRFAELMSAGTSRNTNRSTGITLRNANSIELPFPKQLVDSSSLRINAFERDLVTEQIASRINNYLSGGADQSTVANIPDAIQAMGAGLSSLTGSGMGDMRAFTSSLLGTSVADVATAAQYLIRSRLPGDISRSIDNVTGQTVNPRETLAFEGVNLRTHQFNWDLYPSNVSDSERIREIVNLMKKNVLPVTQDLTSAGIAKAFLRYPSTVEMYLIGVSKEHYIKFKPAMVTSFSVDYGAGGNMSFMKGGKPAGVNIALNLTELEIETADDYGAASGAPVETRPAQTRITEVAGFLDSQ